MFSGLTLSGLAWRIVAASLAIAAACLSIPAAAAQGVLVVDGIGGNPGVPNPDDDNGQPGIQPAGQTSSGQFYPADSCLVSRKFKTLQSALYALDQHYLTASQIIISATNPLLGDDPSVPSGVPSSITVQHDLDILAGGTTRAVIEGGGTVVTIRAFKVTLNSLEIRGGAGMGIDFEPTPPPATTTGVVPLATLTLLDVSVHDNGTTGVYVGQGRVMLNVRKASPTAARHPEISNNGGNGIFISGPQGAVPPPAIVVATCSVSDTDLFGNKGHGLFAANHINLLIEDTRAERNAWCGLAFVALPKNATVRRCTITENAMGGIWIADSIEAPANTTQRAIFTGNTVRLNHLFGIRAENSWVEVRNQTITDNFDNGVLIQRGSDVWLGQQTTVSSTTGDGVSVDQSSAHIDSCTINDNHPAAPPSPTATSLPPGDGIDCRRQSRVTVTHTTIQGNGIYGVMSFDSTLTIDQGTTIAQSGHSGMYLGNTTLTLQDSALLGNSRHGIFAAGSKLNLQRAQVWLSEWDGAYVKDASDLKAQQSGFALNHTRAIELDHNVTADFTNKNFVFLNDNGGMSMDDSPGAITIKDNFIAFNEAKLAAGAGVGIDVQNGSNPTITGNQFLFNISNFSGGGVRMVQSGGTIGGPQPADGNLFFFNEAKGGVGGAIGVSSPSGPVLIQNNTMQFNQSSSTDPTLGRGGAIGVWAAAGSTGGPIVQIRGNRMQQNTAYAAGGAITVNDVKVEIGGPQSADGNTLQQNTVGRTQTLGTPAPMVTGGGIYIHNQDPIVGALIRNNTITDNTGTGIHLRGGGKHDVRDNQIRDNEGHGISIVESSIGSRLGPDNTITGNKGSGISVGDPSEQNAISRNSITQNSDQGIQLWSGGNTEIPAPIFTTVSATGVTGAVARGVRGEVEVFNDPDKQGKDFQGSAPIKPDGTFSIPGAFGANGDEATVTLTDPAGNTSEFGRVVLNLDAKGLPDATEMVMPGKIIPLNDNDSGPPPGPDKDNEVIDGPADLADMAELSIDRRPNRLNGGGVFLAAPAALRIFDRNQTRILGPAPATGGAATTEVRIPDADIDNPALALTYHAEGVTPGSHVVSLIYRDKNGREGGRDQVRLTVVQADLNIGTVPDADEMTVGGFVGLNADDDNGNNIPDKDENGQVAGEDDLVPITLALHPAGMTIGSLELSCVQGATKIKIWTTPDKTGPITLPMTWPVASLPPKLYVEGVETSAASRDVQLRLTYTDGIITHEDDVALTVVVPKLNIASVPPLQKNSVGGYVVLNDDDDDHDGTPDLAETGTVAGEHNLVPITLEFEPSAVTTGTLELSAPAGGADIQVWQNPDKGTLVPLPATWPAGQQPKTLYVEGVATSAAQRDVELRLRYTNATEHCDDTVRFTVYAIDTMTWVARPTSPITPNPNRGGGWRIFPDQPTPTAPTGEWVDLQVQLRPALASIPIYFQSFDADDPSASAPPLDDETQPTDNRGAPISGSFAAGSDVTTITKTTNAAGVATAGFRVSFQPGDNYLVAASCESDVLTGAVARQGGLATPLVYDGSGRPFPTSAAPPSQRKISDLLTVWRHLNVRLYTMVAPGPAQNNFAGVIKAITPHLSATGTPMAGIFDVTLDRGLPGKDDQFEDGMLRVGASDYTVLGSVNALFGATTVEINLGTGQSAPAVGATYQLWDDDKTATPPPRPPVVVVPPVLPAYPALASPTGSVAGRFAPAYIDIVPTQVATPTMAFTENINGFMGFNSTFRNVVKPLNKNSATYWEAHVTSGFQGDSDHDLDPDSSLAPGRTWPMRDSEADWDEAYTYDHENYTMVYEETLRESTSDEAEVVAHELGHEFGCDHGEGGLMDSAGIGFKSPNFTPTSLNKIRSAGKP